MAQATVFDHPGLFVQVVPPQVPSINGVPFNIGAIVGSASFGPVNSPVKFSNYQAGLPVFGSPSPRKYDLMTVVFVAQLQGNQGSFIGVRVTDGTDTAATGAIGNNGNLPFWMALAAAINSGSGVNRGPSQLIVATATATGLNLTAKYTGSFGNQITATLSQGSQAGSFRVAVTAPGVQPEVFDNVGAAQAAGVSAIGGIAFTANPVANSTLTIGGTVITFVSGAAVGSQVAIGGSLLATLSGLIAFLQGSSDTNLVKFRYSLAGSTLNLIAAAAGTAGNALTLATNVIGATVSGATLTGGVDAMTSPTLTVTAELSSGTDGATSITKQQLLGADVFPRTGMYALRGSGANSAVLADLDDVTSFPTQDAFSGSENMALIVTTPAGDTIANAEAQKFANQIDTTNLKYLLGDWITFNDTVNNVQRKISPQGFYLGCRMNLGPHESALNKPIFGIVSTEKSAANQLYADGDLAQLYRDGIDVIALPSPGNQNFFACQNGRNASSNPAVRGENYTYMTNFLAQTLQASMGVFVGKLQSIRSDDLTRRQAKATIDAYLGQLADRTIRNPPMLDDFQTILDSSNNTASTIPGGFMFAYVKAVYMSVVEFFAIQLEGGQGVQITRSGAQTADTGSSSVTSINAPFLSTTGF